jgi:hypothetical protein
MSISTPDSGGNRRTSAVSTGTPAKKAATAKAGSTKTAAKTGAAKATPEKSTPAKAGAPKEAGAAKAGAGTAAKAGAGAAAKAGAGAAAKAAPATKVTADKGGGRRPIAPVKVNQGRNWGPIALFLAVGLVAAGIIAYGAYYVYKGSETWEDKANAIPGIINWRERDPKAVTQGVHNDQKVNYTISPPVGGPHNNAWQRCAGDVYQDPIASEHAVHSMEHGAVWITYRPDLPKDQVDVLAGKVRSGLDYLLMSPYEGLDKPISLQAWGYQLKLDDASDPRVDQFISTLKQNASMEGPTATCTAGNYTTGTGTNPRVITPPQAPGGGMGG